MNTEGTGGLGGGIALVGYSYRGLKFFSNLGAKFKKAVFTEIDCQSVAKQKQCRIDATFPTDV